MTADCTVHDTLCELQRDVAAYVAEAVRDDQIDRTMVMLGIFNGREYIYSEVDGKSTIMIVTVPKSARDPIGEIPPDFLD